jgi:tetratricopeptide (TPR) repeat protein
MLFCLYEILSPNATACHQNLTFARAKKTDSGLESDGIGSSMRPRVCPSQVHRRDFLYWLWLVSGFAVLLLPLGTLGQNPAAELDALSVEELLELGWEFEARETEKAVRYFRAALSRALEKNDLEAAFQARLGVSSALRNLGQYLEALEEARRAGQDAQRLRDRKSEAQALRVQANALSNLGDYQGAIRLESRVLDISRDLKDKPMEATSWGNIGVSHWRLKDWKGATEATEKALALFTEIGDKPTWILNNSGVHAMESADFGRAAAFFEEALVQSRDEGSLMWEALLLSNMGDLAVRQGKPAEALSLLDKAAATEEKSVQPWIRQRILRHRAQALALLGEMEEAVKNVRLALDISREMGDRGEQMDNWEALTAFLREQEDFQGALVANESFHALREEILNERVRNSALVSSVELELAEQERRLANLEAAEKIRQSELEAERQISAMARLETRAVASTGAAMILVAVLLFWRYRAAVRLRREAAEREAAEERLRATKLQQELDRVQQERLLAEQKARLEAMHATVRTAQDILGNALNKFQILRYAIEDNEPLSAEELDMLDDSIRRASEKMCALGNQTRYQTREIGQSGMQALVFDPVPLKPEDS